MRFLETFFKRPILVLGIVVVLQYAQIILGKSIGWDTTAAIYPYFLFIVDCFKNLVYPYYNPFVLGGFSLPDNFFTAFMFNPLDFFLALLGCVLPPFHVFQLQFPVFAFLSGRWVYDYFKIRNDNELLCLLGGMIFSTAIMFPLRGQGPFFFSFVLLAFLLSPYNRMMSSEITQKFLALLALLTLMMKSYFFFVPFVLLIAALAIFTERKQQKKILLGGLVISAISYAVLTFPILTQLKMSLTDLNGNFISPEPRLRSLVPEKVLYSPSLLSAIADVFDANYLSGGAWTKGVGISVLLLFLCQLYFFLKFGLERRRFIFLLFVMAFSILTAHGTLRLLHENIPILSSFRWAFSYIHFAQMAYIAILCSRDIDVAEIDRPIRIKIAVIMGLITSVAAFINFSGKSLALIGITALILFVFIKAPRYVLPVLLLSVSGNALQAGKRLHFDFGSTSEEGKKAATRSLDIEIIENKRAQGDLGNYEFDDRSWLYEKIPTLEGYNNSIHPIFWYLKGHESTKNFVIPLCEKTPNDWWQKTTYHENDNVYLEEISGLILRTIQDKQCPEAISEFYLSTEDLKFRATSAHSLVLQNVTAFDVTTPIISETYLPGGMRIIGTKPGEMVELKYQKERATPSQAFVLLGLLAFLFLGVGEWLRARYWSRSLQN
jgi:hypothetical protein